MLKERIHEDVKLAMRARDRERLGVLRMVTAAIKQKEVDDRVVVSDEDVLLVLDKMAKQRKDSLDQFQRAGRTDLAEQESFELGIIEGYLPAQLSAEDLQPLIASVFERVAPGSIGDMGKVMGALRPDVQGRADMGEVSRLVRERLATL